VVTALAKNNLRILIIILAAFLLRIFYSLDLPLNGDEVGVGVLQAAGQANTYQARLFCGITPAKNIAAFIDYSEDFSEKNVCDSLRNAGMHPPFYYLLLHYLIKYFGNAALTLRGLSILASLLSIIYIYRLGKALFNEKIGLYAALVLALSGYGIWLGTLVRPYSVIMLFSLVTTYQAWRLNADNQVSLRRPRFYLYIFIVILSFYTLYHFIFVFAFQIVFLLLHNYRNKKALLALAGAVTISSVCFLPWVPSLLDQMTVVRNENFYFHEDVDLAHFIGDALSVNFVRYFQIDSLRFRTIIALVCAFISGGLIIRGIYFCFRNPNRRIFILAFFVYFLIYLGLETALGMTTFNKIKMLFFVMPVLFIFCAAGLAQLPSRLHLDSLSLLFFCALLLANSLAACFIRPKLGGPEQYLEILPPKISEHLTSGERALLILNTDARRYLFPFVHALDTPENIDILILPKIPASLPQLANLKNYDNVFIANLSTFYDRPPFTPEQLDLLTAYLDVYKFSLLNSYDSGYKLAPSTLLVFQKLSP